MREREKNMIFSKRRGEREGDFERKKKLYTEREISSSRGKVRKMLG